MRDGSPIPDDVLRDDAKSLVTRMTREFSKRDYKIVIVGDLMVDHWVHGHLADSQDGCQKFVTRSIVSVAGGVGNAARSIDNWDVSINLHGGKSHSEKWRFICDDDKIVFRFDQDAKHTIPSFLDDARADALDDIVGADAVLLSDYDKEVLTPEFIRDVVNMCLKLGIPCVSDCKRSPSMYAGSIIKGNMSWAQKYANELLDNSAIDMDKVVITNGGSAPNLYGQSWTSFANLKTVPLVNHVGAGDCFAAHLILALACGLSLGDAAKVAHSAGRVYVQHRHNRPPYPAEIDDDMRMEV